MNGIEWFQKKGVCIVLGICMMSLAIGSFYDYQISNAIFDKGNPIAVFLAAYGQLPTSLGMSIFGTLLIYVCEKKMRLKSIGAMIGGCLLNAMAIFMCILEPTLYYEHMPIVLNIVIAAIIIISANVLILRFVKDMDKNEIVRFIKFGVFVIIAQMIIINLIKIPWGRPRMRMIVETPQAVFQPWWVIGSSMKSTLMALGVASEEFKSFPSGHTASATCILIFSLLPMMKVQLQKYTTIVFWSGFVFASVVGISRIFMGAHFLSDITIGLLVCFLIMAFAYRQFYGRKSGDKL